MRLPLLIVALTLTLTLNAPPSHRGVFWAPGLVVEVAPTHRCPHSDPCLHLTLTLTFTSTLNLTLTLTPPPHRGVVRAPGLVVEVARVARRAVVPRTHPHLLEPGGGGQGRCCEHGDGYACNKFGGECHNWIGLGKGRTTGARERGGEGLTIRSLTRRKTHTRTTKIYGI